MHKNQGVLKIIEAMCTAYAQNGTQLPHVSNYMRQTTKEGTQVCQKESAHHYFVISFDELGGKGALEIASSVSLFLFVGKHFRFFLQISHLLAFSVCISSKASMTTDLLNYTKVYHFTCTWRASCADVTNLLAKNVITENMTGEQKLRKENQALRSVIANLKEKLE